AHSDALLLDLRGLSDPVAQVVELGPAHVAPNRHLDLLDDRRVHGERALDTDAEADLADLEGLAQARALAADDDALEQLDPLPVALDHADVHLHGVAGGEVGDVVPQAGAVDEIGGVHGAKGPSGDPWERAAMLAPLRRVVRTGGGTTLGIGRSTVAEEIGTALGGAGLGRGPTPRRDPGVVPRAQDLGHGPAAVLGRAGVLRVLEQPV